MGDFVHLHLHTEYSLLDGVGKIEDYMKRAKSLRMKAIAITDHGNMFGALEFYQKAQKYGLKPIIGVEIYLSEYPLAEKKGRNFHLILLAENYEGYQNLMKLSSLAYLEGFYYKPRLDKELLKKYSKGIIALSACMNGEIASYILEGAEESKIEATILEYQEIFGKENFYLEVQAHEEIEQKKVNEALYAFGKKMKIPLVATNDTHYVNKGEHVLQDVIVCIQTGSHLSDEKRMKIEMQDLYLKSYEEMYAVLGEQYQEALQNSVEIAKRCQLWIPMHEFQFPDYNLPEGISSLEEYLKKLTYEGLGKRYPQGLDERIIERVEYELSIINKMGYAGYFVVVWDFISFARSRKIPIGPGRGSAAGSLVAYALEITQLDPLEYHLIFERFLNPERISMPDIDIDICQERRQEIIDYVVQKYGQDKVAQIATFGTLKARAAIRDVGRVMDVELAKIDKAAKCIPMFASLKEVLEENIELKTMYQQDVELKNVINTAMRIENKVRHISTHAAGVLITKKSLTESVPLYADSKNGIVSTQYQMKELEELGLLKIDFLGLRTLTILQRTQDYIEENTGKKIELSEIPLQDKTVYEMLSKGDSFGVFQMESRGLRSILKRLQPNSFGDIVALLSLYRPGPLGSGMVDDFIDRKHGKKAIEYPHPSLEEVLKETYGVILYQEQVMKIANIMADYSLGEADLLRRAMGKKNVEIMHENRSKFIERSIKKGYSREKAEEIFDLIDKFAGYGFNKSHSAAYALIAYWTAYCKVHYPKYFYAALLSSEISDIDKISFYFADAKAHGVEIETPDVQFPSSRFVVKGDKILFALSAIKNVGTGISEKIKEEREKRGEFRSYEDFVERMRKEGLNKKGLEAFIYAGALDSLPGNRHEKIESLDKVLDYVQRKAKADDIQQMNLFGDSKKNLVQFSLSRTEEYPMEVLLEKEKEFLGFYVSANPLDQYESLYQSFDFDELNLIKEENMEREVWLYGIIQNLKKTRTKKGDAMAFADLENYQGQIPMVIFPKVYQENGFLLLDKSIVFVKGKVQIDYFRGEEIKKVIVQKLFSFEHFLSQSSLRVYLHIVEQEMDVYPKLKESLLQYRGGETELYFALQGKKGKKLRKSSFSIRLTLSFLEEVSQIIGKNRIKIKWKESEHR